MGSFTSAVAVRRHVWFSACLLLSGCAMPHDEFKTMGEVIDDTGSHRLRLKYIAVPIAGAGTGYDFHSLVWETVDGNEWKTKSVIARADFQSGAERRRWVMQLHGFDPGSARAIIKVGQEDPPQPNGSVHVTYSWREWDISTNREVRIIRVCDSPHEPFERKANGS